MRVEASLRSVVTECGAALAPELRVDQRRALEHIGACRTVALGWHRSVCGGCGEEELVIAPNSCRNRHCPRCLGGQAKAWFEARQAELLPVSYFHLVFTLPRELRPLCRQNAAKLYGLLFRAAARTLVEVAANPKRLGAELGFFGVLHTWGRDLRYHPHVHFVVPGGGLARAASAPEEEDRWVEVPRASYFLPVQVLAPVFRGKFLEGLKALHEEGELRLEGRLERLKDPRQFGDLVRKLRSLYWHVYAEPPFAGPRQVLGYLARYTHRAAISDERIFAHRNGEVTFRFRDHAAGGKVRTRTLPAIQFLRRFVPHILPRGFQRMRHYGFLANRYRKEKLARCRRLLGVKMPAAIQDLEDVLEEEGGDAAGGPRCEACGGEVAVFVYRPHPGSIRLRRSLSPPQREPSRTPT